MVYISYILIVLYSYLRRHILGAWCASYIDPNPYLKIDVILYHGIYIFMFHISYILIILFSYLRRHILGAWCTSYSDPNPYLHIDLLDVKNITAISSQGVEFTGDHWVSSYDVSYSCDGQAWQTYWNSSTIKVHICL